MKTQMIWTALFLACTQAHADALPFSCGALVGGPEDSAPFVFRDKPQSDVFGQDGLPRTAKCYEGKSSAWKKLVISACENDTAGGYRFAIRGVTNDDNSTDPHLAQTINLNVLAKGLTLTPTSAPEIVLLVSALTHESHNPAEFPRPFGAVGISCKLNVR